MAFHFFAMHKWITPARPHISFSAKYKPEALIRAAESSRTTQRTYWAVKQTMSDQKFVKVKIAINDQTYADTKVAEKDYKEFELELDHLLRRFEMVTGC